MINSDLILFIENVNSLTHYEIKKKIYELTNNLDIDLLNDLKNEVHNFYTYKIHEKIHSKGLRIKNVKQIRNDDDETPHLSIEFESSNTLPNIDVYNHPYEPSYDQIMDSFLGDFEFQLFEDVLLQSCEFYEILEELIRKAREREFSKKTELIAVSEIEEPIDSSDIKRKEKIIFLELLGIIDFLRKEFPKVSINKLASPISAITGIKPRTIQSMINPMLSKSESLDQRNNPMKSEDDVKKAVNKLINMGFNPK